MPAQTPNPASPLLSPQAAALLKNKAAVKGLMDSPDTKALMSLLNQNAGGGLKNAANAALNGDTAALMGLMQQVMDSKEGAELVHRMERSVPK